MLNNSQVAMYCAATDRAIAVVEAVRNGQLDGSTPCSEWTVQQLIDHLVWGTDLLLAAVAGREPVVLTGAARADFRIGVERVLEALSQPGVMERRCRSPLGDEWPVGQLVAGTSLDVLVHTWDLACATGQDEQLDAGLVEACTAMFLPHIADRGRETGAVGPEVLVGDDASPQDRLLAAMGRTP